MRQDAQGISRLAPHQIYEAIVNSLPIGFSLVDEDGLIREFNPAAEKITGYSREEVVGTSHVRVIHGSDKLGACPLFSSVFEQRSSSVATETTIRKKGGERVNLTVTSAPLFDALGDFVAGVELFRDVTQLRRIERERKNFLAMIAHDMKNPAVITGGFLRRIESGKAGHISKDQRSYLKLIIEEIRRLEALISSLTEFAKFETDQYLPNYTPYDVEEALLRRVELVKTAADSKGVRVRFSSPQEKLPTVHADAVMVDRVIANLLDNALKYTDSGGTITVRAFDKEDHLLVELSDTGKGISETDLPYVFDAFHQANQESEGSGLGLYISKKILEAHGGSISAESRLSKGSTFRFTLPKG